MLRPFELHRPSTVEDACAMLARLGDDAVVYAGGTELLLLMKEGLLRPRHLVDVKRIDGLDRIAVAPSPDAAGPVASASRITIGATATHRAVERSAAIHASCPVVASVARHVANVRVRNVGTVGGNLAFADPHSDLATLFLAFDAEVSLASPRGRRTIPLESFVRGPWETDRAPDELLTSVAFRPLPGRSGAAYVKFGIYERPTLGIAVALSVDADPAGGDAPAPREGSQPPRREQSTTAAGGRPRIADARIAIGCVNPRPARARDAEARLRGCEVAALDDLIDEVATLAAAGADPADDLHGSADYKREMVAVFTRRVLRAAAARALGTVPAGRREPTAGERSEAAPRYTYAVVA